MAKLFCWRSIFLHILLISIVNCRPRPMSETMQRAIERTKQFQSTDRDRRIKPVFTQTALKARQVQPVRMQRLDVKQLNRLLKTIDKTWVMPKAGVYEPVGSNFQYKKTCASIYKARSNACEQLGFGIMCFNFCYEQGEALEYKCEDASDSQFCQTHSNYDNYLGKFKKDTYRAKAYIHQQLTRCFMSSVCNGALLNTSLMRSQNNFAEPPIHLRALIRKRGPPRRQEMNISAELDQLFPDKDDREQRLSNRKRQRSFDSLEEEEETTTKKYVPFWQRLLVRKKEMEMERTPTPPPELTIEEDAEEEERRWLEQRFGKRLAARGRPASSTRRTTTVERHQQPEMDTLAMEPPLGFWNKFQPGKWFQSVHYITNTG